MYAQKLSRTCRIAELGGSLRVVHIPVGAAGKRGDMELLARVPAFRDPLRARWRRERPDVVHAVNWTSGLAALMATRDLGIPVVQAFSWLGVAERRDHASADRPRRRQPGSGWSWPSADSYRLRRSSHQDGPAPRQQGPTSPRTSATPDPEARHVPAPAPVPSS